MSTPTKSLDATIQLDSTNIGYAKNVKLGANGNLIKEYTLESNKPKVLEQGNLSFPVSIEKLFVDSTHVTQVLNGSKVDLKLTPSDSSVTYTAKNVIFNSWELTVVQEGIIAEKVSGEGDDLTVTTET